MLNGTDTGPGDYAIDQAWDTYTAEEHAIWRTLFHRQMQMLPGRACSEFLAGVKLLALDDAGIPDLRRLNAQLFGLTGWTVVAVPHLIPDKIFFELLANRRFPAGRFIRRREQMDYIQEPDIFHDVFGHVSLLANPVFANYMAAYGRNGLKALPHSTLHFLARLYWYTVEFGLIRAAEGLRIYGAGIVSSRAESVFCLNSQSPHRVDFDLRRVMATNYRIDDFQQTYFVIDSFDDLFSVVGRDIASLYGELKCAPILSPGRLEENDSIEHRGTQDYVGEPRQKEKWRRELNTDNLSSLPGVSIQHELFGAARSPHRNYRIPEITEPRRPEDHPRHPGKIQAVDLLPEQEKAGNPRHKNTISN